MIEDSGEFRTHLETTSHVALTSASEMDNHWMYRTIIVVFSARASTLPLIYLHWRLVTRFTALTSAAFLGALPQVVTNAPTLSKLIIWFRSGHTF